jgi:tetracycline repressor-like protein
VDGTRHCSNHFVPVEPLHIEEVLERPFAAWSVEVGDRAGSELARSRASADADSQGGGSARLRRSDWTLRTLREAGLSKDLTYHAFHIVESHILGFTVQQLNFQYEEEELAGMAATFLEQLPADEYPDFVEHVKQRLESRDGEEGGFELGLDLILDSLERLRDKAPNRVRLID